MRIRPTGNIGNQMLQYMVVSDIVRRVPWTEFCGYLMPTWELSAPCDDVACDTVELGGGYIPVHQISSYLRRGVIHDISIGALSFHVGKLGQPEMHRRQFGPPADIDIEVFGHDYIVVSVRAAEILADDHPDYGPIPLSFIDQAVRSSGKQPVFVGQLGDDVYSRTIRARYPDALFRPSRGELLDFETLRRANEIVVAVSTFSWVAAWLSHAQRIHLPVSGLYNPAQRPDLDLLPTNDPRYVFYGFDVHRWRASEADFESLWRDRTHPLLTQADLRKMKRAALRHEARSRAALHARFARQCYLHRVSRLLGSRS